MSAVESFERDLLDCGVPFGDVWLVRRRYIRALETGSHFEWIELYVGIFATLNRGMHTTHRARPDAAERLLQLINDDLGSDLFDREARAHLALALNGAAA
jgi:hypothetical protein